MKAHHELSPDVMKVVHENRARAATLDEREKTLDLINIVIADLHDCESRLAYIAQRIQGIDAMHSPEKTYTREEWLALNRIIENSQANAVSEIAGRQKAQESGGRE